MVGKLKMSSFQNLLQLSDSYFLEEVMAVLVHWGQVCRKSALCQRSPKSTQLWRDQVETNWECLETFSYIYLVYLTSQGWHIFSTISFLTGLLLSFRFSHLASSCRAILHPLPWSSSCAVALDLRWTLGRPPIYTLCIRRFKVDTHILHNFVSHRFSLEFQVFASCKF